MIKLKIKEIKKTTRLQVGNEFQQVNLKDLNDKNKFCRQQKQGYNEKYGLSCDEIEKKSLSNERFRTIFNFHKIFK